MDNINSSGKRDGKPQYDPSMSIIGWLVVSLVVWTVILVPYAMF
jgi:hypothetical protein